MGKTTNSPIGIIGLGLLGSALAERVIGAGFPTVVYNRTREKAKPLLDSGATWSDNPLADCERILVCLYTTETVEAVLDQLASSMRPGQIIIDTTTGNPQQTAALGERLAERGLHYLESPIAASSAQTRAGNALAMVAGDKQVFEDCQDIFSVIAQKSFFLGKWGNAAMMKLVNNLVLGLSRAALAEGLLLAKATGLDLAQALEVLKQGNAYSVVMDTKGRKMIEEDFAAEGKLSQHLKDVRLILEEGGRHGLGLPLSTLHRQLLKEAESAGLGDLDNRAIIKAIEDIKSPILK